MLQKTDLYASASMLERMIVNRENNEAVVNYYNAAKTAESDLTRRLEKMFYALEHEITEAACRRVHPPKPHFYQRNPDLRNCLGLADKRLKVRKWGLSRHSKKTYGNLSSADFDFMLTNLREAKVALETQSDILKVPEVLQKQPVLTFLLAIDPKKLLEKLPGLISNTDIARILATGLTSIDKSEGAMLARIGKLQCSAKHPSTSEVRQALELLQSDELNALFHDICFERYRTHVTLGGGVFSKALRAVREAWSKCIVWILVLFVDLLDILVSTLNLIIFKPLATSLRVLHEDFNPAYTSAHRAESVELFGGKLSDIASIALHKFGKRAALTLGTEPNYTHKIFEADLLNIPEEYKEKT